MKRQENIKKGLYILFMLLLLAPMIQYKWPFAKVAELKGSIEPVPADTFSVKKWFKGTYQENEDKYINRYFGFRPFFVKLHNEWEYSLFDKFNARSLVKGKDGFFYEENYIKAYYGRDYIGDDKIKLRLQRMKYIQDTLAKLHKTFILVLAPGKASYYPEYIPDSMRSERGPTNYAAYMKYVKALGVNCIDFNGYFMNMKPRTPYPLYSQGGVHWSYYGTCLAADTIIKYVESKQGIRMRHISWTKVKTQRKPEYYDNDIEDGMNLLIPLPHRLLLGYPEVSFDSEAGKTKPSMLVVGDSHFWGLEQVGLLDAFTGEHFWYYNREVYPETNTKLLTPGELDLKEQIKKYDVVMLLATEPNLLDLGWGFVESLYQMYRGTPTHMPHFYHKVDSVQRILLADPVKMKELKARAARKNISADSMAVIAATDMMEAKFQRDMASLVGYIKTDEKWMADIRVKAKARHVSLDSMMKLDARWVIENDPNK